MPDHTRSRHRDRLEKNDEGTVGASTGLLVSVIRTLATSESTDQRELERNRLEAGYCDSGRVIDGLVAAHQNDLTTSLQSFRKISSRITAARERVRNIRNSLQSCKSLLQCRRDDLKKLWLESSEQKHVCQLLNQMYKMEIYSDHVRAVRLQVHEAIANRCYLSAADSLLEAVASLEGDLQTIEGLRNLKSELRQTEELLFKKIVAELEDLLYIRVVEEQMYEVLRNAERTCTVGRSIKIEELLGKTWLTDGVYLKTTVEDANLLKLNENNRAFQTEANDNSPIQNLAVLLESIVVLRRLPALIERLKHGLIGNLQTSVRTSAILFEQCRSSPSIDDPRNLSDFLHLLFRQFTAGGVLQTLLLGQLARVGVDKFDLEPHTVVDYWTEVQEVIRQLLSEYLDMSGSMSSEDRLKSNSNNNNNNGDIPSLSAYFGKRPPTRSKKQGLFRFDAAAHAMHPEKAEQPNFSNITTIFRGLSRFCSDIESLLSSASGPCALRKYIDSFIRNVFLHRVQNDLQLRADVALKTGDSWKAVISTEEQRMRNSPEVLRSSARTLELCLYVHQLMNTLPPYADRLAALWLVLLAEYRHETQKVYEQVTRSARPTETTESPEWRKISAAWAVDQDISRLLKSLPNWLGLVESYLQVSSPMTPITPSVESADQIRKRNQRESEILIANLGLQKIDHWEVITDPEHIRSLASMHESLEWLSAGVKRAMDRLPTWMKQLLDSARIHVSIVDEDEEGREELLGQELQKRLSDLDEMASTCLLMLHLELRVHCFYHLMPLARRGSHSVGVSQAQEADEQVLALNRDLVRLHGMLQSQLQPRKVRYIFEGLGHLVAVIFIHSSQHIIKINDNGKKRMCRNIFVVQQCLSAITGNREPDLDTARKFFELLYRSPDDILTGIVEKGPKFTELEYTFLLSLAIRSNAEMSAEQGALESRLHRLRQIMTDRSN